MLGDDAINQVLLFNWSSHLLCYKQNHLPILSSDVRLYTSRTWKTITKSKGGCTVADLYHVWLVEFCCLLPCP